jgi:hypothetical protein
MINEDPYMKVEQQGEGILIYYKADKGYRCFISTIKECGLIVKRLKDLQKKGGDVFKAKTYISEDSYFQIQVPKEILPKLIEMLEQEWKYASGKQKRPEKKKFSLKYEG